MLEPGSIRVALLELSQRFHQFSLRPQFQPELHVMLAGLKAHPVDCKLVAGIGRIFAQGLLVELQRVVILLGELGLAAIGIELVPFAGTGVQWRERQRRKQRQDQQKST